MSFPVYLLTMSGENPRTPIAIQRIKDQFGTDPIVVLGANAKENGGSDLAWDIWPVKTSALTLGQLACASGHMEIMVRFLASDSPYCLICEDDVEFLQPKERFEAALHQMMLQSNFPEEDFLVDKKLWSWLHCGGRQYPGIIDGPVWADGIVNYAIEDGSQDAKQLESGNGCLVRKAVETGWNTCCYFVSRKGAASLLNRGTPISTVYDALTRYPGPTDLAFNTTIDLYRQDPRMKSLIGGL